MFSIVLPICGLELATHHFAWNCGNQCHSATWDRVRRPASCLDVHQKKHHGNDQSSLATHRAANYPAEMRTVSDCICIFHDLNCQFIWAAGSFGSFCRSFVRQEELWFHGKQINLHRKRRRPMVKAVSYPHGAGDVYFLFNMKRRSRSRLYDKFSGIDSQAALRKLI